MEYPESHGQIAAILRDFARPLASYSQLMAGKTLLPSVQSHARQLETVHPDRVQLSEMWEIWDDFEQMVCENVVWEEEVDAGWPQA